MKILILFLVICSAKSVLGNRILQCDAHVYGMPDDFIFGVSTSAYQIEGAVNEDGKGDSVWDRYLEDRPKDFVPGPNGTEACDSYHNYMRDVEMLRELGADFYRFSISWSRVLPTGFAKSINKKAIKYYQNLFRELKKYDIEPMITMYDNDLPQALEDLGGWANKKIIYWFEDYARTLFTILPSVRYWITINEPSRCFEMYSGGKFPPGIFDRKNLDYVCVTNMLLAHARAYRLYDNYFRRSGINNKTMTMVGMSLALDWAHADIKAEPSPELDRTVRISKRFTIDLYLHPLLSKAGDYPPLVRKIVDDNSKRDGLKVSRLPKFSKKDLEMLRGALDFIGINFYTTYYVKNYRPGRKGMRVHRHLPRDLNVEYRKSGPLAQNPPLSVKLGIRALCKHLTKRYKRPPLFVTEFGWPTGSDRMDIDRITEMFEFIKGLFLAIVDNNDLRGLAIRSLMDSIEWTAGTTVRYGLYEVDFASPTKTRLHRFSAKYYRNIIETHKFIHNLSVFNREPLDISPRKAYPRENKVKYYSIKLVRVPTPLPDTDSSESINATLTLGTQMQHLEM